MRHTLALFFICISAYFLSQGEGKIKKYDINSSTVTITDSVGKTKTDEIKKFDEKGNLIYLEEYSKKGTLKQKSEFTYSSKNLLVEEKYYDDKNVKIKHVKHSYNLELITKSDFFNTAEILIYTISFTYNGFGEKIEEIKTDPRGKVLEKSSYEYDNKGLKTKKSTFNAENKLIETKTYTYTFD